MFFWIILIMICGSIAVANFQSIKENGSTAIRWLVGIISAILAFVFLMLAVYNNMDHSEWSQLSKEEQDIIKDNVQWGQDVGLLD